MAAGFRRPEEVLELAKDGKNGGPDFVTLPSTILDGLKSMKESSRKRPEEVLPPSQPEPNYISYLDSDGEKRYKLALEQVAVDKVPEGLKKFADDTAILEEKLKARLMLSKAESLSTMPDGWNADVKL